MTRVRTARSSSEFDFGFPLGAVSALGQPLPVLRYPDAGNVIGSATYGAPATSVFAGYYPFPAAGVTVDGVTANGQYTFLKDLSSADLQSVRITLYKKELGAWVEIPATSYHNIHAIEWLTAGDYYMQLLIYDNSGDTAICNEMTFTNAKGATAPIAFIAAPQNNNVQGENDNNQ